MNQLSGQSTNNSATAMLDSSATSSVGSSLVENPVVSLALLTRTPSFILTAQDLSQTFSQALGNLLSQILAAMQNQTSQLTVLIVTVSGSMLSSTCASSSPINSLPRFAARFSAARSGYEITEIITWVEAFTEYMWIFCCTHPSRWQDMTQYKLLILQTTHQFSNKAWLHYDTWAVASRLANWSHRNSDMYNFHTHLPHQQQYQPPTTSSSPSKLVASSSISCRSWNNGSWAWPYGQSWYCHYCEKCEAEHPSVNCPFWASMSHAQPSWSSIPPQSKHQRR